MESQSRPSLPIPGTPEYEELPQYAVKPPLPFRRTIRRQATGLPHTDEGVITTSGAQSFDECVQIAVVVSQFVFQDKCVFHGSTINKKIFVLFFIELIMRTQAIP